MKKIWKNTALATVLSTTLAACGGGGGGGGVDVSFDPTPVTNNISFDSGISGQLIGDFISVVHTLSEDELLDIKDAVEIFEWVEANEPKFKNNELENYRITIDDQEMSLQKGFNMLLGFKKRYYDGKESFWKNTANTGLLDDENEDYLALKDIANEDKVKDKQDYYNELESTGKSTVVSTTATDGDPIISYSDTIAGDPVVTYTDWSLSSSVDGESTSTVSTSQETDEHGGVYDITTTTTVTPTIQTWNRTKTTTTPYTRTKTTVVYTTTITEFSNGTQTKDITKTVSTTTVPVDSNVATAGETKNVIVENDPVVTTERVIVVNPVIDTEVLTPIETVVTTEGETYTETTSVLGTEQSSYTEEGSATTETSTTYSTADVDNGDNTITRTTTKYTVTTTTLPVTTYYTKVRTYTDTVYKDVTVTTTTTPRTKNFYVDGSEEVVNGASTQSQQITKTFVSTSERSVTEIVDSSVANTVTTSTDDGVVHLVETIDTAYTEFDTNLGTRTENYNTDKNTYETDEYNEDNNGFGGGSYNYVNASSAYSKGWTGEGSIVAVADTGYDTDHSEFEGQVVATKDYYGNGIQDNQGHGTHVLGTIVAKKDGSGIHGVAFDAKAVVIKIGDSRSVSLDSAANGLSWAADQGAIVGNLSANSNYDSTFRNSITGISDGSYKTTSAFHDYENGVYYNMLTPDQWKESTDKGLVLVNSAGNQGLDISAMPGWFATETDADGNLVLGGKVLIVGSYNVNTGALDSFSNRAGHLCRVIIDDSCRDQYKTSDFYVVAPGSTYSTNKDGGYGNMSGTSMAAPIVTGQIAILHQMWPHMKGENLVKLVTTTANKDIANYNVNIHGQGLVDFDEATKPQGAVGIPTTGRVDGGTSSISNTHATGSGSMQAVLSNLEIMVLDDFDRDYYMNLGNSFTVKDNRKYSDVEMLVDNKNTFLPHQQMYGSFAQGGQWDLAKNYNFGLYTGENGSGDYSLNVGKNFFITDKFKLKTSIGHMSEQETWLGNSSDGVLAVGDNNDTTSASIGVAYQLGNNVLSLDYSKGKTDINTVDGSLIKSFSDVETESYRLAYEIHKDTHTTFGWSFSLPSHVTSGTMDLEVAESVNLDGTINYTNINSDLTQGTKEKNLGFFYSKAPSEMFDTGLNFTAEYRMDKSGVANNDGVEMAVNMVKKFAGSCKFLWMKNPKCFDKDGNMKANLFGTTMDNATKHGLVYDMKTDKFIPINETR
tara:strand:+ start:230 stop:3904 length:3675 start_codon:yes stop_codon:yes gene_type:complete